jgi:predicted nucleic acid-binding protein
MKLYLDNCCYNRPFDDQSQERIYIESEAVLIIIERARQKVESIVGSDVLMLEMSQMLDADKKQKVSELYSIAGLSVKYTRQIYERAQEIKQQSKLRSLDSLHIACAEKAKADVLLTTDDRLEKESSKLDLTIKIMNPLKYLMEVF